jgi:ornithine decarboxylase
MKQLLKNGMNVDVFMESPMDMIREKVAACPDAEDAFFVCDLGDVIQKFNVWRRNLPRVEPFYAVKCNDDLRILSLLAKLGTGFDCASKAEIQKVLSLKVAPSRIVYANPCKQSSHIKYATKNKVGLTTFDNETELHKMKALNPGAQLILRILPPQSDKVQCQLGNKFGCQVKDAGRLLAVAKELGLNVIGVSFHVGSGCYDAAVFASAVRLSRVVFDLAAEMGFNFTLLDIGGGFPGQKTAKISFDEICDALVPALDEYFPEESGVRIIAEPGRFFVASAFTIAVNVIAKRRVARDSPQGQGDLTGDDEPMFMYYVNDGVYGSFNCLLFDHAEVTPIPLQGGATDQGGEEALFECSIWGPTCDGLDCLIPRTRLRELHTGSWVVFPDMGAYTLAASSTFNGMPRPQVFYMSQEIFRPLLSSKDSARFPCKGTPLDRPLLDGALLDRPLLDPLLDAAASQALPSF